MAKAANPSEAEIEEMRALARRFPVVPRRRSLAVLRDSMYAFILRELRDRFGRSRAGYFWAIAQPILFLVGLVALRSAIGRGKVDIYGVSGVYFFWLGLVPFFMFMNGFNRGMGATRAYRNLFQFRQVQPIDLMFARVLIEYATLLVVFAVLMAGFVWYGESIQAQSWLALFAVMLVFFVFTFGCVLLAEVAILKFPDARQMINIVERPLFIISGTFFTIDQVPPNVREYLLWNPLLHGVDLARGVMLYQYEPVGSWSYFCGSAIVVLLLGLWVYRSHRRDLITQ